VLNKDLIDYLKEFVTEERFGLFQKVLGNRTRYVTLVLEDIYQSQNASAVLRSCDSFGMQDVHIIENRNECQLDTEVSLGSEKWLTLHFYKNHQDNTFEAIQYLRKNDYRIIATSPHAMDESLDNLNLKKGKLAVFFGTELKGLSETVLENADEHIRIPMLGFAESFNISVAAALTMQEISRKLRSSSVDWQLSNNEKDSILLDWLRKTIKRVDLIEKRRNEEQD